MQQSLVRRCQSEKKRSMNPKRLMILMALFLFIGCSKDSKDNWNCIEKPDTDGCYTGKLVKKGPCGQMVIEILSADKSGLQYAAQWTDPVSRKLYQNVFTVHNICDFPGNLTE